jgi:hypothetical protein
MYFTTFLLIDDRRPTAEDECGVAVAGDGLGILRERELFGDGVALRGVDGMAIEIGAVEFPQVKV